MGLADIRLVVKLMCLCASGRVETPHPGDGVLPLGLSDSVKAAVAGLGGDIGTDSSNAHLTYLSTAIGALAQDNPTASKLLVQLCTQVWTEVSFSVKNYM